MTLRDLIKNEHAKIDGINSVDDKILVRLRELGIYEGTSITCIKKAPFGGPSIYQTSDSVFSLESSLAKAVSVSKA
jgi:Fe2+ transport system protein FeoA